MVQTQFTDLLPTPAGLLQVSRLPQIPADDRDRPGPLTCPVRLSLIVPTYNERGNVERMVSQLCHLLDRALPENYELIVVDDNSPDATWEEALALKSEYPQLRVMCRTQERGLSTAVIRGWQAAHGEFLGVIDGDLQHPPEVLLQLLDALSTGADLAVASRHVEGGGVSSWSLTRRLLSRGAQLLGLIICPRVVGRVSDPMSGYFMVRRSAIAGVLLNPCGYKILLETIGRGAIDQVAEVGYVFQERTEGESKVTAKQYTDYIQHLIRLRIDSGRLGRLQKKFPKRFPIDRFLRFGLVGLSGVVVDMALLYLLHGLLGIPMTRSKIIGAECAILNNFFWNDRWTFRDLSHQQRRRRQTFKRLIKFNLVCLMGLILNVLIMNVLFNVFHISVYIANFIAIGLVTLWNFWINLKLSWRVTDVRSEHSSQ